jgi:hypothetical protein
MGAAFVRDGDILSLYKFFVRKMVSRLVIVVAENVIVESPLAAGAVNKMTEIVGLPRAKPGDPASFAMQPPYLWIEPPLGIERRDEYISYP